MAAPFAAHAQMSDDAEWDYEADVVMVDEVVPGLTAAIRARRPWRVGHRHRFEL